MNNTIKRAIQVVVILSGAMAFAQGSPFNGDYVASQSACPYLAQLASSVPGSLIHIDADESHFSIDLKFICQAQDGFCDSGSVVLESVSTQYVGHFSSNGEGGVVDFDGKYSSNGYQFLSTITDHGLPSQKAKPQTNPVLEATAANGGVNLVFNDSVSCALTPSNSDLRREWSRSEL